MNERRDLRSIRRWPPPFRSRLWGTRSWCRGSAGSRCPTPPGPVLSARRTNSPELQKKTRFIVCFFFQKKEPIQHRRAWGCVATWKTSRFACFNGGYRCECEMMALGFFAGWFFLSTGDFDFQVFISFFLRLRKKKRWIEIQKGWGSAVYGLFSFFILIFHIFVVFFRRVCRRVLIVGAASAVVHFHRPGPRINHLRVSSRDAVSVDSLGRPSIDEKRLGLTDETKKKQENRKVKRKTKRKERALELFAWKGYRILGPLRSWSGPWLVREDGATNQELATYRYHFFSLHRPLRTHARPQRESGGSWLATGCVSSTNPVPARNGPWFLIRSLHGKALSRHWLSRRNGNYGRKLALSLAIRTHIFVASILFFVHRQWNVLTANNGIVAHFRRSP